MKLKLKLNGNEINKGETLAANVCKTIDRHAGGGEPAYPRCFG